MSTLHKGRDFCSLLSPKSLWGHCLAQRRYSTNTCRPASELFCILTCTQESGHLSAVPLSFLPQLPFFLFIQSPVPDADQDSTEGRELPAIHAMLYPFPRTEHPASWEKPSLKSRSCEGRLTALHS